MKRLFAGACCALFALSLAACGSSPASSSIAASSAAAAPSTAESVSAPDAGSASAPASSAAPAESASGEEKEPIPRTIGEDGAVVFGGLHFQVDPSFAIQEDDTSLMIVYSEQESFVTITATEGMELEEGSALKGMMPALMIQGYLSVFDKISSQQDSDLTIAGVPAKGTTFVGTMTGTSLNCFVISLEDNAYTYLIAFAEAFPEESHVSDLQDLLGSMSLDS